MRLNTEMLAEDPPIFLLSCSARFAVLFFLCGKVEGLVFAVQKNRGGTGLQLKMLEGN